MEIRKTKLEDLKHLPHLYRQNYCGETNAQTNIDGMIKKFTQLQNNNDYIFISAIENDELIGFCQGVLNYEIIENQQPVLTIWNVRVLPKFRRQGVGRKLMNFAEKFAKSKNAIGIFLGADFENQSARIFYKNLGFKENYSYFKLIDREN